MGGSNTLTLQEQNGKCFFAGQDPDGRPTQVPSMAMPALGEVNETLYALMPDGRLRLVLKRVRGALYKDPETGKLVPGNGTYISYHPGTPLVVVKFKGDGQAVIEADHCTLPVGAALVRNQDN